MMGPPYFCADKNNYVITNNAKLYVSFVAFSRIVLHRTKGRVDDMKSDPIKRWHEPDV